MNPITNDVIVNIQQQAAQELVAQLRPGRLLRYLLRWLQSALPRPRQRITSSLAVRAGYSAAVTECYPMVTGKEKP